MNIGPSLAADLSTHLNNDAKTYLGNQPNPQAEINFSEIPLEHVLHTLKQLNTSKSTALDSLPSKVFKIAVGPIAPLLPFIFDLSLSMGIFVEDWKRARLSLLFKADDRGQTGNHRTISILPIASHVFEKKYLDNFTAS